PVPAPPSSGRCLQASGEGTAGRGLQSARWTCRLPGVQGKDRIGSCGLPVFVVGVLLVIEQPIQGIQVAGRIEPGVQVLLLQVNDGAIVTCGGDLGFWFVRDGSE